MAIRFVKDREETLKIFNQCGTKPIFKSVGVDEDGVEVAIPCFITAADGPCKEDSREKSSGDFDMNCNSSVIGHMQRMMAVRAEMKKAGIV